MAPRAELGDYFGQVRGKHLVAYAEGGAAPSLELQCIEAGYSPYDVESRPAFSCEGVLAGVVRTPHGSVVVFGRRDVNVMMLFDVDHLAGAQFDRLSSEEMVQSLERANREDMHAERPEIIRLRASDGSEVHLQMSRRAAELLRTAEWNGTSLASIDAAETETRVWRGEYSGDGETVDFRIETASMPSTQGDAAPRIGLATWRFRDRRFEGPIASGSPWPDRRALGRDMERLEAAGIEWWNEESDERSAAALSEFTGRAISATEYRAWITQTLGQHMERSAAMVTCHLPEVWHMAMLEVEGGHGREMVGINWMLVGQDGNPAPGSQSANKLLRYLLLRFPSPPASGSSTSRLDVFNLRRETARFAYPLRLQPVPPPP